jgi:tetrapyrrole methylase family protein/MazG family protein
MSTVTIAGLPGGEGPVPEALADRLRRAGAVFVADAGGPAAARLAALGIEARPLPAPGDTGDADPDSAPDGPAATLRAAAGAGEAFVVVDAPLPPLRLEVHPEFAELVRIMARLRDPDSGCPWDLEQTHATLRPNMIEEAYEVVEAIDHADDRELVEELGDVLLQIAFHAQMAAEAGTFTIDDVSRGIVAKLVFRHPHIFGDTEAGTAEDTLARWDQLKKVEKPHRVSVVDGIPPGLPSLMAAQKISRRVVASGFEWKDTEGVYTKLAEELAELRETQPGSAEAAEEIGDVLFTVVNLARRYGVDAETALRGMNEKFSRRWRSMERMAGEEERPIGEYGAEGLETLWERAKRAERAGTDMGDS